MSLSSGKEVVRDAASQSWWGSILSDIHFWVPVAVLMGGLLLLRFIR
jgi:hypothetical protein